MLLMLRNLSDVSDGGRDTDSYYKCALLPYCRKQLQHLLCIAVEEKQQANIAFFQVKHRFNVAVRDT